MFPLQSKPASHRTFEEVFLENHVRLNEWALQLTDRDRPSAEDLVQELYVRFADGGSIGEHVADPVGYLLSSLRNLHYARLRRARTSAIDYLSIVDYDSAERSLRAVDRNGILFIREELQRVCGYLCERKNTSRSASIFILRYFLGYYPNELMKIAKKTRGAVDEAIQAARNEARLELERPGVLHQFRSTKEPNLPRAVKSDDPQSIFVVLRTQVFTSCTGKCFAPATLKAKYQSPNQDFTTAELAHMVSCFECLDRANQLLGLPPLAERSPDETIGRDTPQGPSGSAGATPTVMQVRPRRKVGDSQLLRKRMRRYLEEVKQHRPQRLLIAVDGDIRASQKVTAQLSELRAELRPMEKPALIEVLSEQGICLAYVPVQTLTLEGNLRQVKDFELSDNRTMKVVVSFVAESPVIQVTYNDPIITMDVDELEQNAAKTPRMSTPIFGSISTPPASWRVTVSELLGRLRHRTRRILPSAMNPLITSAMLFSLCAVVCLLLSTRNVLQMPATTLLSHAEQSETLSSNNNSADVVYQKIRISSRGHASERSIYRGLSKKYRFKQQPLSPADQQLKKTLSSAGVNWDQPLSAEAYRSWHDHAQVTRDTVQKTGRNLLTLTTVVTSPEVVQQSLTVRESDFHPIEREVVLRDQGTEVTKIEIAELSYAVLDPGSLSPSLFENPAPDPISSPWPVLPPMVHLPSEEELNLAELQVREKLHELGVDLGEAIHIKRSSRDVEVSGVISTSERAHSLRTSLSSLPHVVLAFHTPEELSAKNIASIRRQALVSVQDVTPALAPPLLDAQLKQDFPNDRDRTDHVNHILDAADQCTLHARALNVLLQRYHSLNDHEVRKLANDHLQALTSSSSVISSWIGVPYASSSGQSGATAQVLPEAEGDELAVASRNLEHDVAELLTAHASHQKSPRDATAVVASCQQHLKTIQSLIEKLR